MSSAEEVGGAWPTQLKGSRFVEVGEAATSFPGDEAEARAQFERLRALCVKDIFSPSFFSTVMRVCATTTFTGGNKDVPGFREVEEPQRLGRIMNLTLSRPALLRWLEAVTGCGPLSSVEGRVTQTLCRPGDELWWHDDFVESERRRLAIVIQLSVDPYEGGGFELRKKTGEILFGHRRAELGSALIFEVHRNLEHRVLPITAGGPRRVFAGWALGGVSG